MKPYPKYKDSGVEWIGEVPHVPDAWIDKSKTVKGYEINIAKYFYKYKPLRRLEEIRTEILELEAQTEGLISEVVKI